MMRSMYSGVSGLQSHQLKMDVIGNNIANVNTVGYKAQRVTFSEAYAQTLQNAAGASDATGRGGLNPMQVGLGVNVSSIDSLMTQGAAQRTDNPFDLMIVGDGFIPVSDGTGTYYTRAGALRQDADGNLVIPNGMKVQGWPAVNGEIQSGMVTDLDLGDAFNATAPPEATTQVSINGNLNPADGADGIATSVKMYDSLGNLYTMELEFTYDEDAEEWTLGFGNLDENDNIILTDSKGDEFTIASTDIDGIPVKFTFDEDGNLASINDGLPEDWKHELFSGDIDINGRGTLRAGVEIDFDGLTQYAANSSVNSRILDGRTAGDMMGYNIGPDGKITAYFTNGETELLGQIVIAQFDNPAGLQRVGDNLFAATANSGDFDSIGQEGTFQTGVLEMSNVDLSTEFTEMIITQRGFQANSRIISVSDEILQELVNMKR